MTLAEYSLLHGNAFFSHFKQQLSVLALIGITFFPAALIPAFPRPPVLTIGIAINRAAAGDSNVLLLKGIDKGRVVHQLDPFPTGKNQGIFPGIAREADCRAGANMQVYIALQPDCAGKELACGNNYPSTALRGTGSNGLLKCLGAIKFAIASGPEFRDVKAPVRKRRWPDARQYLRNSVPRIVGVCAIEPVRRGKQSAATNHA